MSHRLRALCIPRYGVLAATVVLAQLLLAGPVRAADLFYDATLDLPVGDDARFFLNLTNRHYAPPQPVGVDILTRCARPADDFPIVMLLADASGRDPGTILSLRLGGSSWSAIFVKLNVSHDVLFAGLDHDPGPPYGKAWGHWKNHRGQDTKLALADDQIVALAKLQTVSAYYRVSPYRVTAETNRGMSVERYAVAHGRPAAVPARKPRPAKANRPHRGAGRHGTPPGPAQGQTGGPDNHH